jgi:hypothetical protein
MCNVVIKGGPDENVYLMKKKMSSCTGVVYFVLRNGCATNVNWQNINKWFNFFESSSIQIGNLK